MRCVCFVFAKHTDFPLKEICVFLQLKTHVCFWAKIAHVLYRQSHKQC
jgi:hypothetical protein